MRVSVCPFADDSCHCPILDALGRTQKVRVLSEPDVLRLIMESKPPSAEKFER